MLVANHALAQRLESHEAWSSSEHARTQAQLYPETDAVAQPIADGWAVYCGRKSPISQVYGWGLSTPVMTADLDRIEAFYRSRNLRPRVRACPLADPSLRQALHERHYQVHDQLNVYARCLDTLDDVTSARPGVHIELATPEDARLWFVRDGAEGDWAEPNGLAFMIIRCTLKAATQLYLAWRDGGPVSGGALEIHNGVAALMAAGTLPAFRTQGLHTALLHARLTAALNAGCKLALVHTGQGAMSQQNVLRAGFQLMYTVDVMMPPS